MQKKEGQASRLPSGHSNGRGSARPCRTRGVSTAAFVYEAERIMAAATPRPPRSIRIPPLAAFLLGAGVTACLALLFHLTF